MSKFNSAIYASATVFALLAGSADAATSAGSSAYGAAASLKVANTVSAVAAVGPVSGTAPLAYDRTVTVASVNQNLSLVDTSVLDGLQSLRTGVITDKASSAYPMTLSAAASATVDDLSTSLYTTLFGGSLTTAFGLSAGTVGSTTSVGVGAGGLTGTGSARIEGLSVTGGVFGALGIDGTLFVNPNPNTVLLNLAGLSVTLNEQKQTLTGLTDIFRETNAIHIALTNYALAGSLVTGDIVIGHSQAQITGYAPSVGAVPEPATWGLMIVGFGLVGAAMRRRRQVAVAA